MITIKIIKHASLSSILEIIIFYGVRSSSLDNYFQRDLEAFSDWKKASDDGVLTSIPAFSRDQVPNGYQYVFNTFKMLLSFIRLGRQSLRSAPHRGPLRTCCRLSSE